MNLQGPVGFPSALFKTLSIMSYKDYPEVPYNEDGVVLVGEYDKRVEKYIKSLKEDPEWHIKWLEDNKELLSLDSSKIDDPNKLEEILGELVPIKYEMKKCLVCDREFAAFFKNKVFCFSHNIVFLRIRDQAWAKKKQDWLNETYPKKEKGQLKLFK